MKRVILSLALTFFAPTATFASIIEDDFEWKKLLDEVCRRHGDVINNPKGVSEEKIVDAYFDVLELWSDLQEGCDRKALLGFLRQDGLEDKVDVNALPQRLMSRLLYVNRSDVPNKAGELFDLRRRETSQAEFMNFARREGITSDVLISKLCSLIVHAGAKSLLLNNYKEDELPRIQTHGLIEGMNLAGSMEKDSIVVGMELETYVGVSIKEIMAPLLGYFPNGAPEFSTFGMNLILGLTDLNAAAQEECDRGFKWGRYSGLVKYRRQQHTLTTAWRVLPQVRKIFDLAEYRKNEEELCARQFGALQTVNQQEELFDWPLTIGQMLDNFPIQHDIFVMQVYVQLLTCLAKTKISLFKEIMTLCGYKEDILPSFYHYDIVTEVGESSSYVYYEREDSGLNDKERDGLVIKAFIKRGIDKYDLLPFIKKAVYLINVENYIVDNLGKGGVKAPGQTASQLIRQIKKNIKSEVDRKSEDALIQMTREQYKKYKDDPMNRTFIKCGKSVQPKAIDISVRHEFDKLPVLDYPFWQEKSQDEKEKWTLAIAQYLTIRTQLLQDMAKSLKDKPLQNIRFVRVPNGGRKNAPANTRLDTTQKPQAAGPQDPSSQTFTYVVASGDVRPGMTTEELSSVVKNAVLKTFPSAVECGQQGSSVPEVKPLPTSLIVKDLPMMTQVLPTILAAGKEIADVDLLRQVSGLLGFYADAQKKVFAALMQRIGVNVDFTAQPDFSVMITKSAEDTLGNGRAIFAPSSLPGDGLYPGLKNYFSEQQNVHERMVQLREFLVGRIYLYQMMFMLLPYVDGLDESCLKSMQQEGSVSNPALRQAESVVYLRILWGCYKKLFMNYLETQDNLSDFKMGKHPVTQDYVTILLPGFGVPYAQGSAGQSELWMQQLCILREKAILAMCDPSFKALFNPKIEKRMWKVLGAGPKEYQFFSYGITSELLKSKSLAKTAMVEKLALAKEKEALMTAKQEAEKKAAELLQEVAAAKKQYDEVNIQLGRLKAKSEKAASVSEKKLQERNSHIAHLEEQLKLMEEKNRISIQSLESLQTRLLELNKALDVINAEHLGLKKSHEEAASQLLRLQANLEGERKKAQASQEKNSLDKKELRRQLNEAREKMKQDAVQSAKALAERDRRIRELEANATLVKPEELKSLRSDLDMFQTLYANSSLQLSIVQRESADLKQQVALLSDGRALLQQSNAALVEQNTEVIEANRQWQEYAKTLQTQAQQQSLERIQAEKMGADKKAADLQAQLRQLQEQLVATQADCAAAKAKISSQERTIHSLNQLAKQHMASESTKK